ncbi:MAG: hypothetical protein ACHQ7M_21085, partial [Chloroflexota bacterium]
MTESLKRLLPRQFLERRAAAAVAAVGLGCTLLGGAAPAAADGPTPAVCYYHASSPTLASGSPDSCEMDAAGNVKVSAAQFPAPAALADNAANPTTTQLGADMLLWDRTNNQWIRLTALPASTTALSTTSPLLATAPLVFDSSSYQVLQSARQQSDGGSAANVA